MYWHLDFGDACSAGIDLVLTASRLGRHSLVIRPFDVPLDAGGDMLLTKRVLEAKFEIHWKGIVVR